MVDTAGQRDVEVAVKVDAPCVKIQGTVAGQINLYESPVDHKASEDAPRKICHLVVCAATI